MQKLTKKQKEDYKKLNRDPLMKKFRKYVKKLEEMTRPYKLEPLDLHEDELFSTIHQATLDFFEEDNKFRAQLKEKDDNEKTKNKRQRV